MFKTYNIILLALALVIIACFFFPWVSVESPQLGALTKVLTGKAQGALQAVSGYQIPILANGPDAQLIISIAKFFNPNAKDVDKKSWLVWGVPVLAAAIFLLSLFLGKNKWFNLAIGLLGVLVFAVALFKIKTTPMDKVVLKVNILYSLWFILLGYLGMGLACLANFVRGLKVTKQ